MKKYYLCGPTVYNTPHIGNLRPILTFDLMIRALRYLKEDVYFLHNITDIDDKIINKAIEEHKTEEEIAKKYEKYYFSLIFWDSLIEVNMKEKRKLKKALLVYNPKSGNSDLILNNFDLITSSLLKNGITLTLYSISREYNELTNILKNEKYDILILSGGDGTLSKSLSQLYNEEIEFPDVAIFPTGTSNDLAKSLNLGDDVKKWIDNIVNGKAKPLDFGLINNKTVFLSSYAGGLFTKVSYNTDKNLKKVIGKTAYHIAGLAELTNIRKFDLNITLDSGEKINEKAILYMILNGKSVGGFDSVIDNADMNDGLMNILIVKNIENPFDLPAVLLDLINSNLENNDYVRTVTAKSCVIEKIDDEVGVSIDGEEGKNKKAEIRFISNRLKIFRQ